MKSGYVAGNDQGQRADDGPGAAPGEVCPCGEPGQRKGQQRRGGADRHHQQQGPSQDGGHTGPEQQVPQLSPAAQGPDGKIYRGKEQCGAHDHGRDKQGQWEENLCGPTAAEEPARAVN